jgi:elongation factor Ts
VEITAGLVKELRERTGAGMMECKKALQEVGGDIEKAIDNMRKSGVAKAAKKAGRIAAEGVVVIHVDAAGQKAAMVEVNCETDFVTKADDFQAFSEAVAACVLRHQPGDVSALMDLPLRDGGDNVETSRQHLVAKIGENINVRRFTLFDADGGVLGVYRHGARIGVLVGLQGGNAELAKDVAMHVAASRPVCLTEDQVSQDLLEREKEIFMAQAAESGKPREIVEKMVVGRMQKFLKEITLLGQPFVKDPETSVGTLLSSAGATAKSFVRFEVGEGMEKKTENFAEEVMAQAARGA